MWTLIRVFAMYQATRRALKETVGLVPFVFAVSRTDKEKQHEGSRMLIKNLPHEIIPSSGFQIPEPIMTLLEKGDVLTARALREKEEKAAREK
jgi:hypothetical protein